MPGPFRRARLKVHGVVGSGVFALQALDHGPAGDAVVGVSGVTLVAVDAIQMRTFIIVVVSICDAYATVQHVFLLQVGLGSAKGTGLLAIGMDSAEAPTPRALGEVSDSLAFFGLCRSTKQVVSGAEDWVKDGAIGGVSEGNHEDGVSRRG